MNNQFVAAIDLLDKAVVNNATSAKYRPAQRVLEAAAKVDKKELLSMADWKLKCFVDKYGPNLGKPWTDYHWVKKDIEWWQMLCNFAVALPDKEDK
jgi:hypothetical protein